MHPISYQLKRAHLCTVAFGRKMFRGTKPPEDPDFDGIPDMTPARFDILYLVLGHRYSRNGRHTGRIGMADLVRRLGLARATISKAVKRLVELGLVTCSTDMYCLRRKIVALTPEGSSRIRRALHLVFTGRQLSRHYRRHMIPRVGRKRVNLSFYIDDELNLLVGELSGLARHFFDRSEYLYSIRRNDEFVYPRFPLRPLPPHSHRDR